MSRVGSPAALVAIAGGALGALMATIWIVSPAFRGTATTHSTRPSGSLAAYRVAEELGVPVRRWERPFDPVPRDIERPAALAVLAPARRLRPTEAEWLDDWVRGGGRLLYVASGRSDHFLERLGLETLGCRASDDGAPAAAAPLACTPPEPSLSDAARVLLDGTPSDAALDWFALGSAFGPGEPGEVLLTAEQGDVAAAYFARGAGEVVVLSDQRQISNERLATGGGAVLLARSLAHLSRGDPVWFDEYHHGFDDRPSLHAEATGFLVGTDLGWGVLQLALVLLAATAAAGRRLGSPIAPEQASTRSTLDHVDALALAYRGAGARRRAARLLREGLRLRLRLQAAQLDAWLAGIPAAHPELAGAAGVVCDPATLHDDEALVGYARAVDDLLQEERHGSRR